MAKVTLTSTTAAQGAYLWVFTTLTDLGSTVVARRLQHGNLIEFRGANTAAVVAKINSYESYLSDNSVTVSHL